MKVYVVLEGEMESSAWVIAVYSNESDAIARVEQEKKRVSQKYGFNTTGYSYSEHIIDEDKKA